NYSELTAQSHRAGSWVLYIPQERALYLIDESTEDAAPSSVETYTSVIEAVRALAGGHTLAIEEQYLSAALSLELEKAGFTFACVSMPLGNWRDVRDHEDLAAQI